MKTAIRKTLGAFLVLFALLAGSLSAAAQSKKEIIHASYFVAFGRYASSGEVNYWMQNIGSWDIQQMVNNHREYLKGNQYEREEAVKRSYQDAFGWGPSADELRYWAGQNKTYAELMTNHISNWLNVYRDKKEHVVRQSYYKVFGRTATADELRYWMGQPTCSYVQLVAMHTTWKQQNQSKSTVTRVKPNINSNGISTSSLSPQAISGVVAAGGMNVVSPGGGNVVAAGGMNVVAPGGGN